MKRGVTDFGTYIPRLRINRSVIAEAHRWMAPSLGGSAKGRRAFAEWDEDAITMAVEAARASGIGRYDAPQNLVLASTTLPYADLQNSSIVAEALRLPAGVRTSDGSGSQRAGTSALLSALRTPEDALIVASDAPVGKPASVQELRFGAGAAAFRIGSDDIIAELLGAGSVSRNFPDHFRSADARYDYIWEERWVRDEGYLEIVPRAVDLALVEANVEIAGITHFAMPSYFKGAAQAVAKKIGFAGALVPDLDADCGYAGAAHALLMLAAALEQAKPGERILLVGFGQGADALIFEATDRIADRRSADTVGSQLERGVTTDSYMRLLSFSGAVELEWGMRSERDAKTMLTDQVRASYQVAGFVAGQCAKCGTIQFPQLQYCVAPGCNAPAEDFEQVPLADLTAKLVTYTADWLTYHPAPPLYTGFVQFENGARLMAELVDVDAGDVGIGMALRPVFRIKQRDPQRGYARYFWKMAPDASGEE